MGKKVIIFGCSEFSAMLRVYIEEKGDKVLAYCVDSQFMQEKRNYDNLPMVSFENIGKIYPSDEVEILIAIGYTQMNDIRRDRFICAKNKGYRIYSYIHPTAIISTKCLGEGNIVLENVVVGYGSTIGNCNIFQISTVIAHHTKIGSYNFFAPCCAIAGDVVIKDNCFLGINSTIKNGIHIGSYSLCGAGSIITKSTSINSVIVPARSVTLEKNSKEINLMSNNNT